MFAATVLYMYIIMYIWQYLHTAKHIYALEVATICHNLSQDVFNQPSKTCYTCREVCSSFPRETLVNFFKRTFFDYLCIFYVFWYLKDHFYFHDSSHDLGLRLPCIFPQTATIWAKICGDQENRHPSLANFSVEDDSNVVQCLSWLSKRCNNSYS